MKTSPRMLTLCIWCLFVWLVPFLFLILKYAELQSEKRLAGRPQNTELSELFNRRLDDPSFWAVFASAIAALLIVRGAQKLGQEPRQWTNASDIRQFQKWRNLAATILALAYLIVTGFKKEALFFALGSRPVHKDAVVVSASFWKQS